MNNELKKIQKMLMNQMERLDNNETMKDNTIEIARGNALSQNAITYIKTINVGLRIIEMQEKYGNKVKNVIGE